MGSVLAVMDERHGLVFVLDFRGLGCAVELRGGSGHTERLIDALVLDVLERRNGIAPDVVRELGLELLEERDHLRHQRNRSIENIVEMESGTRVH